MSIVNSNTDTAAVELLIFLLSISDVLQFHDNVETGFPPDCWQVNVTLVPLSYWNPDGEGVILGGEGGGTKIQKMSFKSVFHIKY